MRAYFDANLMIYFVQRVDPWHPRIVNRLAAASFRIATSDLARMECRVKPVSDGDAALLADFDRAFSAVEIVPMTAAVFDRATEIRAASRFKVKTPDALHLAAAEVHGCDVYLTNDHELGQFTQVRIELI